MTARKAVNSLRETVDVTEITTECINALETNKNRRYAPDPILRCPAHPSPAALAATTAKTGHFRGLHKSLQTGTVP
jgi:hypothetical protein